MPEFEHFVPRYAAEPPQETVESIKLIEQISEAPPNN